MGLWLCLSGFLDDYGSDEKLPLLAEVHGRAVAPHEGTFMNGWQMYVIQKHCMRQGLLQSL